MTFCFLLGKIDVETVFVPQTLKVLFEGKTKCTGETKVQKWVPELLQTITMDKCIPSIWSKFGVKILKNKKGYKEKILLSYFWIPLHISSTTWNVRQWQTNYTEKSKISCKNIFK